MIDQSTAPQGSVLLQDAAELAPGAKRLSFACAHGATKLIVLPGKRPLGEPVLRDLLIALHGVATGCSCADALREPAHLN